MRTVSPLEFDAGFELSALCYLADNEVVGLERRLQWYVDDANVLLLRYDQTEAQLVCICVIAEQYVLNESFPVSCSEWHGDDGLWHSLSLRLEGDNLTASRDGETIFEHSDSLLPQMPKTGFIEISNTFAATCFDEIMMLSFDGPQYLCGDANSDGIANITDVVYMIQYIFSGGPPPDPYLAGDINCDGLVNITDAVYLIQYIFGSGPPPCDIDNNGEPDC